MIWLKYGYLALLAAVILGSWRIWSHSQWYRPWESDSPLADHRGNPIPDDWLFFVPPANDLGRITSAATTAAKITMDQLLIHCLGMGALGAGMAWFAFWLFDIKATWIIWSVVSLVAVWFANVGRTGRTHVCTYVGTDGIQISRADVGRRLLCPKRDVKICFDDVTDFSNHGVWALLHMPRNQNWDQPFQDWGLVNDRMAMVKEFYAVAEQAWQDHLWSRALLELATWHTTRQKLLADGEDDAAKMQRGVRCHIVPEFQKDWSSLPGRLYQLDHDSGVRERAFDGYLMFCEEGIVRDESRFLANHAVIERGPVSNLSPSQIDSITLEDDELRVVTSDQEIVLPRLRCPRAQLLVRLFESDIWRSGLRKQIQLEIDQDLDRLRQSGWMDLNDDSPYWDVIPAHRYCVWKAAETLKVEIETHVWSRIAEQTASFRDDGIPPFWFAWPLALAEDGLRDIHRRIGLVPDDLVPSARGFSR